MAKTKDNRIACSSCGRKYAWDRKLAGRNVRCKCGSSFRVPDAVPARDGTYELDKPVEAHSVAADAETGGKSAVKCPACGAGISPEAVVCVQCGFDIKSGKQIETNVAKTSGGGNGQGLLSRLGLKRSKRQDEAIA